MENTKQGRERKENSTEHTRRTRGAYVHHIEDGRQRSLDRCCQTPPWISLRSSGNCDQRPLPGRSPTSHRHCTDICAVNGACIFLTQPTQHKTSAVTTLFHCHTKKWRTRRGKRRATPRPWGRREPNPSNVDADVLVLPVIIARINKRNENRSLALRPRVMSHPKMRTPGIQTARGLSLENQTQRNTLSRITNFHSHTHYTHTNTQQQSKQKLLNKATRLLAPASL